MTDTAPDTTATTPAAPAAAPSLGDQLRQDVVSGVTNVAGDAVVALDQWLVTHIQNSPIGQNGALVGLIGTAFNTLRSLLV